MAKIIYLTGDATEPVGEGTKIIAHVCNDYGGWGRGFVVALSEKSRNPENLYRQVARYGDLILGEVQFVAFWDAPDAPIVANMVAQHGNSTPEAPVAVDYVAVQECLKKLGLEAAELGATVHMPRIGTGLGGGDWTVIEELIYETLIKFWHVDVYVYDLPK